MIDFGANLILGHHPHVLQGIEKYKEGYIVYSLGNFIFSEIEWSWVSEKGAERHSIVKLDKRNRETAILNVSFEKNGIKRVDLIPCVISEKHQPVISKDNNKFRGKIARLSNKISVGNYSTFWRRYSYIQKYKVIFWRSVRRFKKIHKLRIGHFKKLIQCIRCEPKKL